jgi:hypothetical protein
MKRVLIIASDFVPSSLPPATRVRFFVKHLGDFGWEPVVLTVDPKHYEATVDPENQNLLEPDLDVVPTNAFSASWTRKIGIGDIGMRSLWQHWRELKRIHRRQPIDLIFIPVPPYVPMVLGRLARMRLGIPYVIDFIDPWVTDSYWQLPKSERPPKWRLADAMSRVIEPFALRRAAHITGVSSGTTETVLGRYPWANKIPAAAIPYGAAADDFVYARAHPRPNPIFDRDDGFFHMTYAGACPPAMRETIRALFRAVRQGVDRAPQRFERLRLHFVGTSYAAHAVNQSSVLELARAAGIESIVDERPARVSYLESLQLMTDSQALFLVGSDAPHYTASKIFPYLLSGRPLLCIFHDESSVVSIVQEVGGAELVTFNPPSGPAMQTEQITEALDRILSGATAAKTDFVAFEKYSTRAMTEKLAESFDRAVGPGAQSPEAARARAFAG